MATENKSPPADVLPNESDPERAPVLPLPRWIHWRQSGACRLWMAVVLTLNVEPPKKAGELKKMLSDEKYREYKDRKLVAIRQYGVHHLLPLIEHHAAGANPGEQYVDLQDMLAFAQQMGWDGLAPMVEGITGLPPNTIDSKVDELRTVTHISDEDEKRPKGHRYTLTRMGALLELLEEWAKSGNRLPDDLLRKDKLNLSALARNAESTIQKKAKTYGKTNASVFGSDVIRKEFSAALKELDERFL